MRKAGVHAAGVVISPVPLTELVPLYKNEERRNRDRLRHEGGGEDGPAEDGLSRAHDADDIDDALKLIVQTAGKSSIWK